MHGDFKKLFYFNVKKSTIPRHGDDNDERAVCIKCALLEPPEKKCKKVENEM